MTDSQATPKLSLLWSQTFEGAAGVRPDVKFWNHDLGDGSNHGIPGWGNEEREWYTDDSVATDGNGNLIFTATKLPEVNPYPSYYGKNAEWSSGKITTYKKVSIQYGRIEAKIRGPIGAGTWPAFWMLGTDIAEVTWPNCGEIDILEMRGRDPQTLIGTIHGPGYCGEHGSGTEISTPDMSAEFHTFGVDWFEDRIDWHFDGVVYQTKTPESVAPNEWVFNHEFYVILNLAMGGGFTGAIDENLTQATMALAELNVYSIDGVGAVKFEA